MLWPDWLHFPDRNNFLCGPQVYPQKIDPCAYACSDESSNSAVESGLSSAAAVSFSRKLCMFGIRIH